MPRPVGAPPLNENGLLAAGVSGQSVVVAHLPSKERARVRFPLAAPATLLVSSCNRPLERLFSPQVVGARLVHRHTTSYTRWRLLMPLSC